MNFLEYLSKNNKDGHSLFLYELNVIESKVFLQKHPELHVMLLYSDSDNKMQRFVTENFKSIIKE